MYADGLMFTQSHVRLADTATDLLPLSHCRGLCENPLKVDSRHNQVDQAEEGHGTGCSRNVLASQTKFFIFEEQFMEAATSDNGRDE